MIYEKGGFFSEHKDSEKEKGMFGTLVIGLPARHSGGELIIRFDGKEEIIDFSAPASQYQIPFAAFYADCDHQIKPVTSRYRICLVYNLVQDKGKDPVKIEPLKGQVEKLTALLKSGESSVSPKIVLLGHQYTPSNFRMESLKLNDRAKAETLMRAAEKANYYAKPCLVTSYQSGELEEYSGSSPFRRRRYYNDFNNEGNLEDGTMGEVYEEYLHIEHWMEGGVPPLRRMDVGKDDLICSISLNKGAPIEKEAQGYTGNEGMTMEYWYHYGAIVLWPKKRHADVLANVRGDNQLEWIDYYNRRWDLLQDEDKQVGRKLVAGGFPKIGGNKEVNFTPLVDFLIHLDDEKYVRENAAVSLIAHFSRIPVESWMRLFEAYPPACFENIFASVGRETNLSDTGHLLTILKQLSGKDKPAFKKFIVEQMLQLRACIKGLRLAVSKKGVIIDVLGNVLQIADKEIKNNAEWVDEMTAAFTHDTTRGYVNALISAVLQFGGKSSLSKKILVSCKEVLKTRVENKPLPPPNWSRPVPNSNSHRNEWRLITSFLKSPIEQVFDYRELMAKRREMEDAVNSVTIDLKMETIRKGSPHTLRLTKTQDAYQRELSTWKEDVELLAKVEKFDGK